MSNAQMIKPKLIVFADPNFPVESALPSKQAVDTWQATQEIVVADAHQLAELLHSTAGGGCLVNLHAPYFPKSAWTAIIAYLQQGEV